MPSSRRLPATLAAFALVALAGPPPVSAHASKVRACHNEVARGANKPSGDNKGIVVRSAQNTTCGSVFRVFSEVVKWLDYTKRDLGTQNHKGTTLGYRCVGISVGEEAWRLKCTRGDHVIRGLTNN